MLKLKTKTGAIIPLGDGSVGKTALTKMLLKRMNDQNCGLSEDEIQQILTDTTKSTNIEMEFACDTRVVNNEEVKVSLQYYVFPGQVQKESSRTVTFDEILQIFQFMPALRNVQILMLVYDVSRFYTLQSLESWLKVAIENKWVHNDSLILFIANKTDIALPQNEYVEQLKQGIHGMLLAKEIAIPMENIRHVNTSCLTQEGVDEVYEHVVNHIAYLP